jgi:excisionase family DNA binding protein
MTTALTEDRLLTGDEAARYLSVTTRHLADLARAGTVPSVPIGKLRRYRLETLVQWAADRERRG